MMIGFVCLSSFYFGIKSNTYQAMSITQSPNNKINLICYKKDPHLSKYKLYHPGTFTHVKLIQKGTNITAYFYNRNIMINKIKL